MEMNPDHPVTKEVHDHWHKIAALVMWKLGQSKVTITNEDADTFACLPDESMPAIIVHTHKESMDILLMPMDEARRYVEKLGQPF
jgi:hypothetical protein